MDIWSSRTPAGWERGFTGSHPVPTVQEPKSSKTSGLGSSLVKLRGLGAQQAAAGCSVWRKALCMQESRCGGLGVAAAGRGVRKGQSFQELALSEKCLALRSQSKESFFQHGATWSRRASRLSLHMETKAPVSGGTSLGQTLMTQGQHLLGKVPVFTPFAMLTCVPYDFGIQGSLCEATP